MTERAPTLLAGRYQLETLLGQNLAQTWLAQDTQTAQPVVVKGLSLQQVQTWKDQELFQREIQLLKSLQHPGVPRFREALESEGGHYLVMDYIPGESLDQWLSSGKRLQPDLLYTWAEQALHILRDLHALRPPVIHRDIKPGNLVWHEKQLYLIDFGGALASLNPQGGSTVTGTYGYMAPEQFAGRAVPASDFYSLGATLIHMASGKAPAELLNDDLVLDFAEHLHLPIPWQNWLQRMVAQLPADRFASAAEALAAMPSEADMVLAASPPAWSSWLAQMPSHTHLRAQPDGDTLTIRLPSVFESPDSLLGLGLLLLLCLGTGLWALSEPIVGIFSIMFGIGILVFAVQLLGRLQALHLSPAGIETRQRFKRRHFELDQLEKIRWEGVQLSQQHQGTRSGAHLQLYFRYQRINFQRLAMGYHCRMDELVWLQQLLLRWCEAHMEPEVYARLAEQSPSLKADPRYRS